ncbi:hypothetical protein [Arthrobacter sp. HLT1-20]
MTGRDGAEDACQYHCGAGIDGQWWHRWMGFLEDLMDETERLVCYSVSLADGDNPEGLLHQLERSLASLRRHNGTIAVVVFLYGTPTPHLVRICAEQRACLQLQGDYAHRLAELCPRGWPVLARYPTLHKFLNNTWLAHTPAQQVLYSDCDTVFRADVEHLFRSYGDPDIVAREEVHSSRSHHGPDTSFLDEPALGRLCTAMGVAAVPPFNTGVVLLNHRIWVELSRVEGWFVECAWQLLLWMSLHPGHRTDARFGMLDGVEGASQLATATQLDQALPFPSANQWILEEIATWLALGALPALRTADFSPADVAQNGEFTATDPDRAGWTLCHYYSGNQDSITRWLDGSLASSH